MHPTENDKNILVAVYDIKSQSYGVPMYYEDRVSAIRGFSTACSNPESNMFKYPQDFQLKILGSYCRKTGLLIQGLASETDTPVICEAHNVKLDPVVKIQDIAFMSEQMKETTEQLKLFMQAINNNSNQGS